MRLRVGEGVEELRSHWYPRPAWQGNRRVVTWHLTFSRAPALHRVATQVHEALDGVASLGPVPVPWLHLTLVGVGHADALTAADLERVRGAVADGVPQDLLDRTLTFDELVIGAEGVMLSSPSLAWVGELAVMIAAATDAALPHGPWAGERAPVWPHVTLAYAGATDVVGPTLEALAPIAAAAGLVDAGRPELTLLELRLEEQAYVWDVVGRREERPVAKEQGRGSVG